MSGVEACCSRISSLFFHISNAVLFHLHVRAYWVIGLVRDLVAPNFHVQVLVIGILLTSSGAKPVSWISVPCWCSRIIALSGMLVTEGLKLAFHKLKKKMLSNHSLLSLPNHRELWTSGTFKYKGFFVILVDYSRISMSGSINVVKSRSKIAN